MDESNLLSQHSKESARPPSKAHFDAEMYASAYDYLLSTYREHEDLMQDPSCLSSIKAITLPILRIHSRLTEDAED